jgi:hypothetical protein
MLTHDTTGANCDLARRRVMFGGIFIIIIAVVITD